MVRWDMIAPATLTLGLAPTKTLSVPSPLAGEGQGGG